MDWRDIAPIIGAVAPVAGGIVGGLVGGPLGSAAGSALGRAVGSALGVKDPTPQSTSDALVTATEGTKRAAIDAAMQQCRAQIQGFADVERATLDAMARNASDVNATMRAEAAQPESLFYRGWRPFLGWSFGVIWTVFGLALTAVSLREAYVSQHPLQTLYEAWPLFLAYFSTGAAMVGVLIPSRSYEKGQALKTGAPMLNTAPPAAQPAPPARPPLQIPIPARRPPPADRPATGGG